LYVENYLLFFSGYIRTIEMQYSLLSQETLPGQWGDNSVWDTW